MNQAIIFNDDLQFNKAHDAWSFTGQLSGQKNHDIFSFNAAKAVNRDK